MKKPIAFLFYLAFISCSSLVNRPTSAEISIKEAERILDGMPDSLEKTIIRISLDQSKRELKDFKETNRDLARDKEGALKIAQDNQKAAGQWQGLRNTVLFISGAILIGLAIYFAFPILKRISTGL